MTQNYSNQRSLIEMSEMTKNYPRLEVHVRDEEELLNRVRMRDLPQ